MELELEKNWQHVKERMMEHDTSLTEDDLQLEPGKENELVERLSNKMNRSTEEVKDWIESLSHND